MSHTHEGETKKAEILAEALNSKLQQLVKKVQDKKSQEIYEDELSLDEVTDILEISESQNPRDSQSMPISILSTMKSIAHTVQSKARWAKFAADHGASSEIYTFSSKGDFSKVYQINDALVRPTAPKHIVMCTNLVRFNNLREIIKHFEEINDGLKYPREFRLYFDELDKYIDTMRPIINELALSKVVKRIVIVTATPSKIWHNTSGWDKIFLLNPKVVDDGEKYLMFKECKYFPTDSIAITTPSIDEWMPIDKKQNKKLIEHHHKILLAHPNLLNVDKLDDGTLSGRVIFAPGLQTRESHELVARFWNHFGCTVIIVNGERTSDGYYGRLLLSDGSQDDIPHMFYNEFKTDEMKEYLSNTSGISMDSQAQLNDIIAEYYHKHKLYNRPLVITGRICVERAQSLVHPVWGTFTDCIYYDATSPDDAYQQQRQLGHIKQFAHGGKITYRGIPRVYAPQKYHDDVTILEERSHKFASECAHTHATKLDYIRVGGEINLTTDEKNQKRKEARAHIASSIIPAGPFRTFDEVKEMLSKELPGCRPQPMHDVGGYKLSTRLKNYYKKDKDDLTAEDRLTNEKFRRFNESAFGISSTSKGQQYMIYPVYPSMTSPPEDVHYYVRYLPQSVKNEIVFNK